MAGNIPPFGVLLRRERQRRRLTQLELAVAAEISTRHLSYLETGRARPSRGMVMRMAEHLDIPLRVWNFLLLSAGFAPAYAERPLPELSAAHYAIQQIFRTHLPYPAFAIDRKWNIVLSNNAIPKLYSDVLPELLRPPINAIRLTLHPNGLAPQIVNFPEWRAHLLSVLRHQTENTADSCLDSLLKEVLAYPTLAGKALLHSAETPNRYATPMRIATAAGVVSFLSTTTVFGTPTDLTLSELALEMLFPADSETEGIVKSWSMEADVASRHPESG
ncbi:helix-turn-helix transcriptional regulator [Acidisphaera sp. S103]|uniref:helix-turn-helix transcriptional regulator n=1 Tax=Acidisphaera sp. S103 TaxID=1747223 RepID=UPI00131AF04F|nr:helix-turn-helix transcriptional regulator [Acidisphaera sp. S103]